jgi:hypothetical protein
MPNEKQKVKKSTIKHMAFSVGTMSKIKEMAEADDRTDNDIIRNAIDEKYDSFLKKQNAVRYGYKGVEMARRSLTISGKKDELSSRRARMNEMDDDTLTAWLIDLGYMKEYEELDGGDKQLYFVALDKNTAKRTLFLRRTYANGSPDYVSPLLDWEELMADLKKEKFII